MARNNLFESEFSALAAVIGVIGDCSLREQLAIKTKGALEEHAPRSWREDGWTPADWKRWFELCRVSAPFEF